MTTDRPPELLEVGKFGRPHGVRGQISVKLSTDRSERVAPGSRLWSGRWYEVVSSYPMPGGERWIVSLQGIDDRTGAEALVNRSIWAEPIEDSAALWVHQIIGATVVDAIGVARGTCVAVVANPANDLLELDSGALVPVVFVTSVAPRIDGPGFVVTVDPPPGLFELFTEDHASPGER